MHSAAAVSAAALLLAGLHVVHAQTFTDCNPLEKTTCPNNPALGTTLTTDFTSGASDDWELADGTTLNYGSDGAEFAIRTAGNAPTVSSQKYIFFGKVDAVMKSSPGTGVVSSFILESDDLDEIDWEWLGSTDTSVESNFFGKGNTTTYDRAIYHPMTDPIGSYHTYTIDWTKDYIKWSIDGNLVRTLNYGDALTLGGKNFPQTPMKVKMGSWIGCADDAANQPSSPTYGTCQWAGGPIDLTQGPFTMLVKSVTIQDYSCGSEYSYGDTSGSYQSIKILGDCNGAAMSSSIEDSAAPSATSSVTSTSGGVFLQTTGSATATATGSATATDTGSVTATATGSFSTATTLSTSGKTTMTSSQSTGTSPNPTSATPASVTANAASTLAPKTSKLGALDFTVIALGLTLGYFVM